MKLALLLPVILLSLFHVNSFSQGGGLQDPDNPYCGKSGSDFSVPAVQCPNGGTPSLQCKQVCYQTYIASCLAAANQACNNFGSCTYAFGICKTIAMDTYDNCILLATTQSAIEACRNQLFADLDLCMEQYEACKRQVGRDYTESLQAAKYEYISCVLACCGQY